MKMKLNNKGFTLVELIVVIAILGVLAAVLVPQYTQYVEKSRVAVDNSYVDEIAHNAELQAQSITDANVGVYTITFTASTGAYVVAGVDNTIAGNLDTALKGVIPVTAFKSKTYKTTAPGVLTMTDGKVTGLPVA
jgi:type IV pilus assembly protein PilA